MNFPTTRAEPPAISSIGFNLASSPTIWKPPQAVGPGVREIRVRDRSGAFRVVDLATLPDRVVVLHVFQKEVAADIEGGHRIGGEAAFRAEEGLSDGAADVCERMGRSGGQRGEAANMRARSELMIALRTKIESWSVNQTEPRAVWG